MTTTLPQMLNRATWNHHTALRNVELVGYPRCSRTILSTLHRWEVITTETERPYRSTLTPLGVALVAALDERSGMTPVSEMER